MLLFLRSLGLPTRYHADVAEHSKIKTDTHIPNQSRVGILHRGDRNSEEWQQNHYEDIGKTRAYHFDLSYVEKVKRSTRQTVV